MTRFFCVTLENILLFLTAEQTVRGLIDRLTVRYRRRADYAEIARVKQKEEEPFEEYRIRLTKVFKIHSGLQEDENEQGAYRQQLKNALHAGSRDAINTWVRRHFIGFPTANLEDYVNHALHAEKVMKDKKKNKKTEKDS
ncbi:hypothetical protein AMECASPLE_039830 [Ameca splendens]|uniref:Uncharacterized protein n=1 Tax=Ameca splendens TaxID=208324 RepID=A0ABV0YK06_9TELE